MTMLAEIGQDARLFALLLEALECALKVLVVMDYDFRQILLPPFVAIVRRLLDRLVNLDGAGGWVKQIRLLFLSVIAFVLAFFGSDICAGTSEGPGLRRLARLHASSPTAHSRLALASEHPAGLLLREHVACAPILPTSHWGQGEGRNRARAWSALRADLLAPFFTPVCAQRAEHRPACPRPWWEQSALTHAALRAAAVAIVYREARVSSKATFSERPGDPRPSGARERC